MKISMRLVATLLVALACFAPLAHADTTTAIYTLTTGGNTGPVNMATFMADLPYPLIPAMADQSYPCNTSGAAAIPQNVCTIPTVPTPYTFVVGAPNNRTVAASTAYQASNSAKASHVTLNLTSAASLSLTSGTTNTALVVIGSTSAVASGTGTNIGSYSNSLTGSLVVGLNISTSSAQTISFVLPAGWYFAVVPQTGTVTITSAFDQSLG